MTKQKRGFWVFLFSLIPGAGEMYMGFKKQGISIMAVFWLTIALAAGLNFGWLLMTLPILWFFSFFNVHNLKTLTEEEFYSIEDDYILHLDRIFGDSEELLMKYRRAAAVFLIVIGGVILWNSLFDVLEWIMPAFLQDALWRLSTLLPRLVVALGVIGLGFYLIHGKKKELEQYDEEA